MPDDDGFLSRWSRRKLAAERQPRDELPAAEAQPVAEAPELPAEVGETAEAETPAAHPADEIDIDTLTGDSDFTVFMQKGVSAAVRRKALRKLWTTDPLFNRIDELQDCYDIELRYGMGPMGKTDWQIGRGFLTDEELARGRPPADEAAPREHAPEADEGGEAVAAAEPEADAAGADADDDTDEDGAVGFDETSPPDDGPRTA